MPYTIQIEKFGTTPPDGLTPLDLSDPAITRTQKNDRIVLSIPDGTDFGTFDPGEIVGLNNVPYMLLSATAKSSLNAFTDGSISIVGPLASGAAFADRKIVQLTGLAAAPVFLGSNMVLRDHLLRFISTDAGPYIIIVTRGHQHDETVLGQAVRTPAQYIGLIGSRGKIGAIFKNLRKSDITTEDLKRVRAPVGLDIGARSPEEISVAIVAEMIAFRRGVAPAPRSPLKRSNRAEQNKSTTTTSD